MKIIDYDGRLTRTLRRSKDFRVFLKQQKYQDLYFDKAILGNALLSKTLDGIDRIEDQMLERRDYHLNRLDGIGFNTMFLSDLCKITNACGAYVKNEEGIVKHLPMGMSEYLYWKKKNIIHSSDDYPSDEKDLLDLITEQFITLIESYR